MTLSITSTVTLNNGLKMPIFGLGTWRSETHQVENAVQYALKDAGYIHIDAAHCYENQDEVKGRCYLCLNASHFRVRSVHRARITTRLHTCTYLYSFSLRDCYCVLFT
jgi:diketogulonate reductase-like aldo/keto reductase